MIIRSICPKCDKEGSQFIRYRPNKEANVRSYLVMIHGKKECYIGRIKTTAQAMGELNRPVSKEDYKKEYNSIINDIKKLRKYYTRPSKTHGCYTVISKRLQNILERYGY